MLIDNPDKLVELVVDSYIWGDLFVSEKVNSKTVDKEKKFFDDVIEYIVARGQKKPIQRQLIADIFIGYFELKSSAQLMGVLKDRDQEKKIETLEKDNENFAGMVKDLYVPTPDPKVGTF